jgi:hypothetical protein
VSTFSALVPGDQPLALNDTTWDALALAPAWNQLQALPSGGAPGVPAPVPMLDSRLVDELLIHATTTHNTNNEFAISSEGALVAASGARFAIMEGPNFPLAPHPLPQQMKNKIERF